MFTVPGNNNRVVQRRVFLDDGLHVADLRTGGVNDSDTAFFDYFSFVRRNSMRPDNQNGIFTVFDFIKTADRGNSPFFQQFNGLRIVDERPVSIYFPGCFVLGNIQNCVHRSAHPHAKPGCFGKLDFHSVRFPRQDKKFFVTCRSQQGGLAGPIHIQAL
jgi:hypothetical protein